MVYNVHTILRLQIWRVMENNMFQLFNANKFETFKLTLEPEHIANTPTNITSKRLSTDVSDVAK